MRQIYTSPRAENIDRVAALMAEHGIQANIANRSNYRRPSYQRFSYSQQNVDRDSWAQVWIEHADDYTKAREVLRNLGIEPLIRHSEELAVARNTSPQARRSQAAARARRIVLLAVVGVFGVAMLHYLHVI